MSAARGPSITVFGAGILGARIARDLLTPGTGCFRPAEALNLVTRRDDRAKQLRGVFGSDARVVLDSDDSWAVADETDVVVIARGAEDQADLARECLRRGVNVVSTSDDLAEVERLLELDQIARDEGVTLVLGATMAPGLSSLLAGHAAALFDRVDEVHVGRVGAAGPSCARSRLKALRGTSIEWRDHQWVRRPGFSGRELLWFPDPIGGRDCFRAALVDPLLLQSVFGDVDRITSRIAANRRDRALAPFPVLLPPPDEGGLGAVRVELRGETGGERMVVIYGALDRPTVAASAVGAVAALWVSSNDAPKGALGIAGLGASTDMLHELARRGVRAATFEGGRIGLADRESR